MTEEISGGAAAVDIYRAPAAELLEESALEPEFYVVAPRKFLLLYIGTLGLYEFYWFYRHWRLYRERHGLGLWPVARAIFSILFVYQLFRLIARRGSEAGAGEWSPGLYAFAYILLYLVGNFSQFADTGLVGMIMLVLSIASIFLLAGLVYRVQLVANQVCGDLRGESNRRLTAANLAWLFIGLLLWLGLLFNFADLLGLIPAGV